MKEKGQIHSWGKKKVYNEIVQCSIWGNPRVIVSFSAHVYTKSSEICTFPVCLTTDQIYQIKCRERERDRVDEELKQVEKERGGKGLCAYVLQKFERLSRT